ncbi:MAG: hypothetical protein M0015_16695 [Betaproteobacteria bacterium]|nr:hypothetical protein [Betaproteobacteria bacterium]
MSKLIVSDLLQWPLELDRKIARAERDEDLEHLDRALPQLLGDDIS